MLTSTGDCQSNQRIVPVISSLLAPVARLKSSRADSHITLGEEAPLSDGLTADFLCFAAAEKSTVSKNSHWHRTPGCGLV